MEDYQNWQERIESQQESGLSVDEFCRQEEVSPSTFYRWVNQLRDGIPQSLLVAGKARQQIAVGEAKFLPISTQALPIEIEFPNGLMVRLPLDVGRPLLLEVIRIAGALRPWKAPKS
ncbi:MAG: transposase [Verrucomicrobia bacterium]|nr:transposase [Verrucomicrobiota bacterium]